MRVGLAGYGAWGRFHARALRALPGVELTAVCCLREATAAEARADLQGVPVVRTLPDLLRREPDVVDIVLPSHLHADTAIAALAAGAHVILEKPLAITRSECDRILSMAARSDRQISVVHEMRVSPQWGFIKREIEVGALGDVQCAAFTLFRHPYRPGAEGWRHDRARVGSWLLEEPVHFFDLLLWYFAAHGDPVSVIAQGAGGEPGMSSSILATVRYAEGACFQVSQMLGGFGHHCHLELSGSDGALRTWWSADTARTTDARFAMTIRRVGQLAPEDIAIPELGEITELSALLRDTLDGFQRGRALVPASEARKAVLLCLAAEEAARNGAPQALSFGSAA